MTMQGNHQNVSTDWCFGECLLLLEAFIERRIELLLMSGIGKCPVRSVADPAAFSGRQRGYPGFWVYIPLKGGESEVNMVRVRCGVISRLLISSAEMNRATEDDGGRSIWCFANGLL